MARGASVTGQEKYPPTASHAVFEQPPVVETPVVSEQVTLSSVKQPPEHLMLLLKEAIMKQTAEANAWMRYMDLYTEEEMEAYSWEWALEGCGNWHG